jgi:hypothetical protein
VSPLDCFPKPTLTQFTVMPTCSGGRYWDKKNKKTCRYPSNKSVWSKKYSRKEARYQTGPSTTKPSTAPPAFTLASKPKLVCCGGKVTVSLCWCSIGKFPKKVG